jgi:Acetyltransferase (GNAT) domain
MTKMETATAQVHGRSDWQVTSRPFREVAQTWGHFLKATPEATLFHRQRWLGVLQRAYGLRFLVALASDASGAVGAGCLFAKVGGPLRFRMVGLPFSDSCPPLSRDAEALAALLRGPETMPHTRLSFEIRGIAAPAPWHIDDRFIEWRLDLDRSVGRLEAAAGSNFRRQIRRGARQGISIECGSDPSIIRRFYALLLATRRRLGVPPPPLRLFYAADAAFGPDDLTVWLACKNGRDLAALLTLRDGRRLYWRWAARIETAEPGANHLLVWTMIENSAQNFESLELGRSDSCNSGLNRFKQELGASSRPLPYSFFPDVHRHVNPEALTGVPRLVSRLWRHLPLSVTRLLGAAMYRHFA